MAKFAEFARVEDLNKEQLWSLRQEISLNSLLLSDYENSLEANVSDLSDYFDGYVDYLFDLAEQNDEPIDVLKDFLAVADKYDNPDNLWDWAEGAETSFIHYDWDDESLEQDEDFYSYPCDYQFLVNDCRSYMESNDDDEDELRGYEQELAQAHTLEELLRTGIFHDACGKFYKFSEDGKRIWCLIHY